MSLPLWLAAAFIALLAIPLSIIDIREHRLPNRMTLSAIVIVLLLVLTDALFAQDWLALALGQGLAAATWLIGYLLAKFELIGMGDVKLLVSLNLLLGYINPLSILLALTLAFTLASIVSIVLLLMRKLTLKSSTPMGPYLLLGFFASISLFTTAAA